MNKNGNVPERDGQRGETCEPTANEHGWKQSRAQGHLEA